MKLKLVSVTADYPFNRTEATNLEDWMKRHKTVLATSEAAAFISRKGDQVVLVRVKKLSVEDGKVRRVYHSQRFRIDGGKWTAATLFQAARAFGVDMAWVRRDINRYFEETYGERVLRAVA